MASSSSTLRTLTALETLCRWQCAKDLLSSGEWALADCLSLVVEITYPARWHWRLCRWPYVKDLYKVQVNEHPQHVIPPTPTPVTKFFGGVGGGWVHGTTGLEGIFWIIQLFVTKLVDFAWQWRLLTTLETKLDHCLLLKHTVQAHGWKCHLRTHCSLLT